MTRFVSPAWATWCLERPIAPIAPRCDYVTMTSKLYNMDMAKERITVYLEPDVARVLRVAAARRGIKDSELVQEALRERLGIAALERAQATATMEWNEALELAVREQHAARRNRRHRAP